MSDNLRFMLGMVVLLPPLLSAAAFWVWIAFRLTRGNRQ